MGLARDGFTGLLVGLGSWFGVLIEDALVNGGVLVSRVESVRNAVILGGSCGADTVGVECGSITGPEWLCSPKKVFAPAIGIGAGPWAEAVGCWDTGRLVLLHG
jgi:hypothetical protein